MLPAIDRVDAVLLSVAVIAASAALLVVLPVGIATSTVVLVVLPSMLVYGAIMLLIGIAHGRHRDTPRRPHPRA